MNKPLTIWFDDKGNLLTNSKGWMIRSHNGKSELAKDFDDCMEYAKFSNYDKCTARAHFKSLTTGREYSMYLEDFHHVIVSHRFSNNIIEGTFHFIKKGQSQAIKLILPPAPAVP